MKRKLVLSPQEIDNMATSTPDLRDEVFIKLLYFTAARITELIMLTTSEVNTEGRTVTVRHLKRAGNRYRVIGIGEEMAKLLAFHISQEGLREGERLFPFTRQWGYTIIRQAAERVGFGGKIMFNPESGRKHYVHPHDLRAGMATAWITARADAESQKALQEFLGHKDISTTFRYYRLADEGKAVLQDVLKDISERIDNGKRTGSLTGPPGATHKD